MNRRKTDVLEEHLPSSVALAPLQLLADIKFDHPITCRADDEIEIDISIDAVSGRITSVVRLVTLHQDCIEKPPGYGLTPVP